MLATFDLFSSAGANSGSLLTLWLMYPVTALPPSKKKLLSNFARERLHEHTSYCLFRQYPDAILVVDVFKFFLGWRAVTGQQLQAKPSVQSQAEAVKSRSQA